MKRTFLLIDKCKNTLVIDADTVMEIIEKRDCEILKHGTQSELFSVIKSFLKDEI